MQLLKVSNCGDSLWHHFYGGNLDEYGSDIIQTDQGFYYMLGTTYSFGSGLGDMYLLKLDTLGDTVWTKTFGGGGSETGKDILLTDQDDLILAGNIGNNIYLVKTDLNGNVIWTQTYQGTFKSSNQGHTDLIKQKADGGFIIAAVSGNSDIDFCLINVDSLGDTIWIRTFDFNKRDYLLSVDITPDNGFIATGYSYETDFDSSNVILLRTDSAGNLLWLKEIGGDKFDVGTSIISQDDGSIMIGGYGKSYNPNGKYDFYLIKADSSGDSVWIQTYGDQSESKIMYSLTKNIDNGYLLSGIPSNGLYIVKTDQNGNAEGFFPDSNKTFGYTQNGLTLNFSDSSTGATDYYWDFGDGNSDTIANPSHTYLLPNTYYVCLTVTDICGSEMVCDSIDLNCAPPISNFGYKDSLLNVIFTDSSLDANSWFWDFGDSSTSITQDPTHIYTIQGTYDVCLKTTNNCGIDTFCRSISVMTSGIFRDYFGRLLKISPNPFTTSVIVETSSFNTGAMIRIFDAQGKMVRTENNLTEKFILKREGLLPGLYLFQLIYQNGRVETGKVVAQ